MRLRALPYCKTTSGLRGESDTKNILRKVMKPNFTACFRSVSQHFERVLLVGVLVVAGHYLPRLADPDDLNRIPP